MYGDEAMTSSADIEKGGIDSKAIDDLINQVIGDFLKSVREMDDPMAPQDIINNSPIIKTTKYQPPTQRYFLRSSKQNEEK